jgi:hypothetical protein
VGTGSARLTVEDSSRPTTSLSSPSKMVGGSGAGASRCEQSPVPIGMSTHLATACSALRDAALFDVLFVQGDRHAENVFLGDDGYFKLIDSRDQALDSGLDSVFFASTISFERNRVGNEHLFNHSKPYVTHHWPQNTLDYRCHVPGGAIGTNYPPKVRHCACGSRCMGRADGAAACSSRHASTSGQRRRQTQSLQSTSRLPKKTPRASAPRT